MPTIITKNSSTASAVPTAAQLVKGELAVNVTDKRLFTEDNSGNIVELGTNPSSLALPSGSVNGVTYLNGSKVLTTGSALTFDGTTFNAPNSVITSSSSSAALRITQTGSGNALLVEDSANPDSTPFVVDASGRTKVGGTTTPTLTGFTPSNFDVISASASGGGGATYQQWSADFYGAQQMYVKSRGGAIGTNGVVSAGDIVGMMRFYGDDGAAFIPAADIRVNVDGTPGTNDMPGRLVFSTTADGASSPTERYRISNDGTSTWSVAGSEQMRLTSTGLGIGTSSPATKLDVNSSAAAVMRLTRNGGSATNTALQYYNGSVSWYAGMSAGGLYSIGYNDAALDSGQFRLDSSGNLGLGVTPSAWNSDYRSFGVGVNSNFYGRVATLSEVGVSANAFRNTSATWTYISTAAATRYEQTSGTHLWFTAPSGTAGNAISFTQAMTLDASGNLGLGTTSPINYGAGYAYMTTDATSGSGFLLRKNNTSVGLIDSSAGSLDLFAQGSGALRLGTGNTERARITSGGEVYIAGTTDQGAYNLQVNGTGVWGAGAYVNGSDARLKENVQTLTDGLSVVTQLRPVTFQYKAEYSKDTAVQPGFIAQELQQAMAGKDYVDGVVQSGPEYLNVAYQSLIPVLTKAIQEQQAIITELRARVAALEAA